ncbi:MAG: HlyD family type I secretion periplasmic adaptor subunit [Burkholderiales bacterium]
MSRNVEAVTPMRTAQVIPFPVVREDFDFMQDRHAALVTKPRRSVSWILWGTALFLGVAVYWAAHAPLDVVVVGDGKVIPSSQVQVVQNLEGGIIGEIFVKIGDDVAPDQPLMRLDATRFDASFKEGKAKDDVLIARIVRLRAEAHGAAFVAPQWFAASNPRLVAEERALFDSRRSELQATLSVLARQLDQRRQESSEKESRIGQLEDSLVLVQKELSITRPLLKQGVVSEVEVLRLERTANDLKGDLDATRLAIPRLQSAIRETEQRMAEVSAKFRADATRELNAVLGDQAAISAANTGLQDRVERTIIKAPVAGTIKTIKVNTVGGVVQPGMDLVEIVPAEEALLIEAKISPTDIAFLHPGQEATVKLSAYDFSIYGGFAATLEYISADAIQPERPNEKPDSYYRVRARTNTKKLGKTGQELPIMPGMVATLDIKTDRRTVLEYLLKPVIKAKDVALRER